MGDPTRTQDWFRAYSRRLAVNYEASALVGHPTTKGEAREEIVLGVLENILPQRLSLVKHPVIIDAEDRESRSFDAAIANLFDYPRLFAEGFSALMVESVKCVIEIKSNLNSEAIRDVFGKVASFKGLCPQNTDVEPVGLSVAFAYACDNLNLRFLDFAMASHSVEGDGVSLACVLNQGLFTYQSPTSSSVIRDGSPSSLPCLIESKEDTLMIFAYLVLSWLGWNQPSEMKEFWAYM